MKHLVTPRLLMRPFSSGDLTDLHALYNSSEKTRHSVETRHGASLPRAWTLEETHDSLEKMIGNFEENDYGMFAVIERKEKRFIGLCGLQPLEHTGLIELRFSFLRSAWGKGFATEAAMEVIRTAFGDWGLEKVVAIAGENDRAAKRVMEKIGMAGSGRERLYDSDVIIYALEREKKPADALFQSSFRRNSALHIPAV